MNALFIGRFQPFHNGHLKIIKNASQKYDYIIIGIGSSQYTNTRENPFSSDERKKMIEETLKDKGILNFKIIQIPDIHNPPKWVDHVVSIFSDFHIIISNNELTLKLFLEKGYKIEKTPLYEKNLLSGKEIRKRISSGKEWESLVPKTVFKIIRNVNGEKRIKRLFEI